jgi:hypothetical protein
MEKLQQPAKDKSFKIYFIVLSRALSSSTLAC